MNREVHVRFWEGLAVRFRWATQLSSGLNDPSKLARYLFRDGG
jgi:hypothetical protein